MAASIAATLCANEARPVLSSVSLNCAWAFVPPQPLHLCHRDYIQPHDEPVYVQWKSSGRAHQARKSPMSRRLQPLCPAAAGPAQSQRCLRRSHAVTLWTQPQRICLVRHAGRTSQRAVQMLRPLVPSRRGPVTQAQRSIAGTSCMQLVSPSSRTAPGVAAARTARCRSSQQWRAHNVHRWRLLTWPRCGEQPLQSPQRRSCILHILPRRIPVEQSSCRSRGRHPAVRGVQRHPSRRTSGAFRPVLLVQASDRDDVTSGQNEHAALAMALCSGSHLFARTLSLVLCASVCRDPQVELRHGPVACACRDAGAVRMWHRKRQRRAPDHEAKEAELAALSSQATLLTSAAPAQQGALLLDTHDKQGSTPACKPGRRVAHQNVRACSTMRSGVQGGKCICLRSSPTPMTPRQAPRKPLRSSPMSPCALRPSQTTLSKARRHQRSGCYESASLASPMRASRRSPIASSAALSPLYPYARRRRAARRWARSWTAPHRCGSACCSDSLWQRAVARACCCSEHTCVRHEDSVGVLRRW